MLSKDVLKIIKIFEIIFKLNDNKIYGIMFGECIVKIKVSFSRLSVK